MDWSLRLEFSTHICPGKVIGRVTGLSVIAWRMGASQRWLSSITICCLGVWHYCFNKQIKHVNSTDVVLLIVM